MSGSTTVIAKRLAKGAYCARMSKRFYLTTAIDYVNGEPHLGRAYEKVITGIARTHRSLGQEVFYLTGLDEHGQKVQSAARPKAGSTGVLRRVAAIWEASPGG